VISTALSLLLLTVVKSGYENAIIEIEDVKHFSVVIHECDH